MIVRSMIHDAAGIARIADHDAAVCVRGSIRIAWVGQGATPVEPPHGSVNLWSFERLWGSMGDERGVVAIRSHHHPDDVTSWRNPANGPCRASQGWCLGPPAAS